MELGARVDLADVLDGLRQMKWAAEEERLFFRAQKKPARDDQREHARDQEGPDGPWPKRASKRSRRKILGRLPRALRVRVERDRLVIESRVRWAGAHQEGARVGRGAQLPKRTFLFWSADFIGEAAQMWLEHVARKWERR